MDFDEAEVAAALREQSAKSNPVASLWYLRYLLADEADQRDVLKEMSNQFGSWCRAVKQAVRVLEQAGLLPNPN